MAVYRIGFAATPSSLPLDVSNPIGTITLWSGAIVDIPGGWRLCDGDNGTPDLRDNFVIGAGGAHPVDQIGGSLTHDHEFTGDGHSHAYGSTDNFQPAALTEAVTSVTPLLNGAANGTTDADGALPPFYALAYIMRCA